MNTASASSPAAPLFRRINWLTFFLTFVTVWIGYVLTLAPEVTLEDSGELATGSFYAGIPHPPGYPVWTIYTWLWTVLVPFKNVAWRVALGEATSGALAAGLLALLVSRGSSLLIEGIEELKAIPSQWEHAICLVSGFVAGLLIGFNGFMWSQSVIVEVYSFSVASFMMVLLCLLRWIYAPHQRRYLLLALFFHGLCFTNHMTLIVAALGIEVAIAAADFRMGRQLWLGNSIIYVGGLILSSEGLLSALKSNPAVFVIYHVVGFCSIAAYLWFTFLTRPNVRELGRDALWASAWLLMADVPNLGRFGWVLVLAVSAGFAKLAWDTRKPGSEWLVVLLCGFCWVGGAAFYFYMPIAGMTDPPMQWGYPRTVEGFLHAFTRGQYEKTVPSDIIHHPGIFLTQLGMLWRGITEEFNWVYAFLALVPFVFFLKLHRRERAWLIGIAAIYLCLGVLLLILLNPPPDRAAQSLVRVFFTASHTLIALLVGYGLTLIAAFMATQYQRFRILGIAGGIVAFCLAVYSAVTLTQDTFFGETAEVNLRTLVGFVGQTFTSKDQYGLPVYAGLILIGSTVVFLVALLVYRDRAPLGITLGIFALMPLHSVMTHWSDNEQREHWFGYWFGHDMFTPPYKGADGKPLYPLMTKDTILFGGTDPGRFCPTYMIFCDSFVPPRCLPAEDPKFDRRDVYLITQNALADGTYLNYLRAQYNRSQQKDPLFFSEFLRFVLQDPKEKTNFLARAMTPLDRFFTQLGDRVEKRRRTYTSWLTEQDLLNLTALATKLRPGPQQDPVSKFVYEHLGPETRKRLSATGDDPALRHNLVADLNRLLEHELSDKTPPLYEPNRFRQVRLSEYLQEFIKQNPQSHTRIRLNRLLLEAAYPTELAKSLSGVYPDREIYIPSNEDMGRCYNEFMADAQRRLQENRVRPGEGISVDPASGQMQISGQMAVMAINGLITKVIFDHNPQNDFYIEESFPLDWMYPYLTPAGIIMKINRQPLGELSPEIVNRDHAFWTQYSQRLIGNWITYDTSIKDIAAFVERVYQRRNFSGFAGDRKFIRDDQAQKSFSKLRSAIGGVYLWRLGNSRPGSPEQQRMLKEADFAFRQSFAFCPYSPEALFRYVTQLLIPQQRLEDALLLARTCQKLDPNNSSFNDLVKSLNELIKQRASFNPAPLEKAVRDNPRDFQAAFNLASAYLQNAQTDRAMAVLDQVMNSPYAEANAFRALVQAYISLNNRPQLEVIADKLAAAFKANPADFSAGLGLAEACRALQKNDEATRTLEQLLNHPGLDASAALQMAQQFAALGNFSRLEQTLEKLVKLAPESPESWYDLAAIKAALGKNGDSFPALRRAFDLSAQRRQKDPNARDIIGEALKDPRLEALRQTPEFKQLLAPKLNPEAESRPK